MIVNKRQFIIGLIMLVIFTVVLIGMLNPIANGKTLLHSADDLFNQLTKGSTYVIPSVLSKAETFQGTNFQVAVTAGTPEDAEKYSKIFASAGAQVTVDGLNLTINGDLGKVSEVALRDADVEFNNNGAMLESKYGMASREVINLWWNGFKELGTLYKQENRSAELSFVNNVMQKGLEPAYNFENIEAVKVKEKSGITIFLLAFYVIYTVLYGFAIMYIFEGLGIVASSHGEKAEA